MILFIIDFDNLIVFCSSFCFFFLFFFDFFRESILSRPITFSQNGRTEEENFFWTEMCLNSIVSWILLNEIHVFRVFFCVCCVHLLNKQFIISCVHKNNTTACKHCIKNNRVCYFIHMCSTIRHCGRIIYKSWR